MLSSSEAIRERLIAENQGPGSQYLIDGSGDQNIVSGSGTVVKINQQTIVCKKFYHFHRFSLLLTISRQHARRGNSFNGLLGTKPSPDEELVPGGAEPSVTRNAINDLTI